MSTNSVECVRDETFRSYRYFYPFTGTDVSYGLYSEDSECTMHKA